MRSSQALSFMGALCLIFGLGIATYQVVMKEAATNSTWNIPHDASAEPADLAFKRAKPGLIVIGIGAGLLLAGAFFERRSG